MKMFLFVALVLVVGGLGVWKLRGAGEEKLAKLPALRAREVEFDAAAGKRLVVRKGERTLTLYQDGKILREYRVALGFSPKGDKEREGDGKTPEGKYVLCVKNPKSKFLLSLGVSYPNGADAEKGLVAGRISREEYEEMLRAEREKRTPPWKTAMGGEVFIHGGGGFERGDWTLGCMALSDEEIRDLYPLVEKGVEIEIVP